MPTPEQPTPQTVEQFVKELGLDKRPRFTSVFVDEQNGIVEIMLEDCSCYAEWIKGEGADICIYRHMTSKRVVGARLPLIYSTLVVQHQSKCDKCGNA